MSSEKAWICSSNSGHIVGKTGFYDLKEETNFTPLKKIDLMSDFDKYIW